MVLSLPTGSPALTLLTRGDTLDNPPPSSPEEFCELTDGRMVCVTLVSMSAPLIRRMLMYLHEWGVESGEGRREGRGGQGTVVTESNTGLGEREKWHCENQCLLA